MMKKYIFLISFILVFQINTIVGQVKTKFYPNKDALECIKELTNAPKNIKTVSMPSL